LTGSNDGSRATIFDFTAEAVGVAAVICSIAATSSASTSARVNAGSAAELATGGGQLGTLGRHAGRLADDASWPGEQRLEVRVRQRCRDGGPGGQRRAGDRDQAGEQLASLHGVVITLPVLRPP
jgi:hypothetical protein